MLSVRNIWLLDRSAVAALVGDCTVVHTGPCLLAGQLITTTYSLWWWGGSRRKNVVQPKTQLNLVVGRFLVLTISNLILWGDTSVNIYMSYTEPFKDIMGGDSCSKIVHQTIHNLTSHVVKS